jgi:hypothetical protein
VKVKKVWRFVVLNLKTNCEEKLDPTSDVVGKINLQMVSQRRRKGTYKKKIWVSIGDHVRIVRIWSG